MGQRIPLQVPPGVFRNGTEYQSSGRWWDADQVRWEEGQLKPIGGWERAIASDVSGVVRAGMAWSDNQTGRFLALGSHTGLYVWNGSTLYDITPVGFTEGAASATTGGGYGAGAYNEGTYGTPRTSTITFPLTTWSFDTWGENLVGVASHEGIIYEWAPAPTVAAVALANAPSASFLFVTSERALVAIGADGDPRTVAWSDLGDNTTWTSGPTNAAGDLTVAGTGKLLAGYRVRGGPSLILSTEEAYLMSYLGQPLVYGIELIQSGCGLIGPLAGQVYDGGVVWMGRKTFWAYQSGRVRPLPCDVEDWVFEDINTAQASKIVTRHDSEHGEVWWSYPTEGSSENNRYVIWNYREGHWSIGTLGRSCWIDDGPFTHPWGVTPAGVVYAHETGVTADGSTRTEDIYATAGPIELGQGDFVMRVQRLIPDEETLGDCQVEFDVRYEPMGAGTTYGPFTLTETTDLRFTGRQVSMRVSPARDADWQWGRPRLEVTRGGRR